MEDVEDVKEVEDVEDVEDKEDVEAIVRWRDPDLERHMWLVKYWRSPIFENL